MHFQLTQNKRTILAICLLTIVLLFSYLIDKRNEDIPKIYEQSQLIMGTIATLSVVSDSSPKAEQALASAFKRLKEIQALMNFWDPNSELYYINKQK